jgi:hypothetical protein
MRALIRNGLQDELRHDGVQYIATASDDITPSYFNFKCPTANDTQKEHLPLTPPLSAQGVAPHEFIYLSAY